MKIRSALFTLVLIGICSAAAAQWQWLDHDGRRVFSDRAPPPDILEKDILKRPSAAARTAATKPAADGAVTPEEASSAPQPSSGLDKELQAKKKQAAEAEAAKRRAEEERQTRVRVENCARSKQALATLDSGMRMARTGANGEREIIDDAARASERAQIQRSMEGDCR
jgi:hypothetical protein